MKPLKITLVTIFSLFTISTYAQYPQTIPTSNQIKVKAENLTTEYSKQLALTGIQIPLFREVVEEYMTKSEKVIEEMEGRAELNMLVELQARETLRMNDILTQMQYRLYKQVKANIQPLKVIDNY